MGGVAASEPAQVQRRPIRRSRRDFSVDNAFDRNAIRTASTVATKPGRVATIADFASGITSSQEQTCSLFGGKLPHTAFLINGLVSPERDETAAWRLLYPMLVC
jgi:hypothetical protein